MEASEKTRRISAFGGEGIMTRHPLSGMSREKIGLGEPEF
jgi:hypothetical protein